MVKIAGIQFTGTKSIASNQSILIDMVKTAIANDADIIITPEISNIVSLHRDILWQQLQDMPTEDFIAPFQDLAKQHNVWIHLGSLSVPLDNKKCANRSYMINALGDIIATYDKIHMYDVVLSETESYKESDSVQAGDTYRIIDTPFGKYGFSICYDIRFSYVYTKLAQMGADIIAIPSAFTDTTGKAHWDILTKARAIESGCFVVAVGQTGHHQDGRDTYGHSRIINPWGTIISELGYEVGIVYADIDIDQVKQTRKRIPSLQNTVDIK